MPKTKGLLPYYGTAEDVERIIHYLKARPQGARDADLRNALGAKFADPRKFDLYDLLGFFGRKAGIFRLTEQGLDFLNADPARRRTLVQDAVRAYEPYHAVLEWAFHNNILQLDADEARHRWAIQFGDQLDLQNEYRLQAAPITFFAVCAFAGLGNYVLGRRGAKSRLEVSREALNQYIDRSGAVRAGQHVKGDAKGAVEDVVEEAFSAVGSVSAAEGSAPTAFVIPVFGKVGRLFWPEPTMSARERDQIKRVLDAMFPDEVPQ